MMKVLVLFFLLERDPIRKVFILCPEDQSVRGENGYKNDEGKQRLNVLELQN